MSCHSRAAPIFLVGLQWESASDWLTSECSVLSFITDNERHGYDNRGALYVGLPPVAANYSGKASVTTGHRHATASDRSSQLGPEEKSRGGRMQSKFVVASGKI
uniref:Uncharacterized protein n=1 Tax=Trichuris muris TaxID=70415 RepID=A0A5S6QIL2_TRIMR